MGICLGKLGVLLAATELLRSLERHESCKKQRGGPRTCCGAEKIGTTIVVPRSVVFGMSQERSKQDLSAVVLCIIFRQQVLLRHRDSPIVLWGGLDSLLSEGGAVRPGSRLQHTNNIFIKDSF